VSLIEGKPQAQWGRGGNYSVRRRTTENWGKPEENRKEAQIPFKYPTILLWPEESLVISQGKTKKGYMAQGVGTSLFKKGRRLEGGGNVKEGRLRCYPPGKGKKT